MNSMTLCARLAPCVALGVCLVGLSAAQEAPPKEVFQVLEPPPAGPRMTPFLRYQIDLAWRQDEERRRAWEAIHSEDDLRKLQEETRQKLLEMIGGLPKEKTALHARITGRIQRNGYAIEKLIFESLPGVYVTALVYSPDDRAVRHPAVLVPAGHAPNGKIHYQLLCQRLVSRGYVVIAWDPVGQGERSQFWDAKERKSRYNLICAEHAILGNMASLAGANLARWEVWDGIRAVDYLLTRPDVDGERISITGTSGGGTQTALIAALDPRIKVAVPSCYITSLPMRMANRIYADPDSDPEQDIYGMISRGVDHPGLLLLLYPRPVMVASAILDFFPIEGARKSFRDVRALYEKFGHGDRIAMVEGYHKHEYSAENQAAALAFLDRFNLMPIRTGLAEPAPLADRDLLCTESGQVMLEEQGARPLLEVIREYYQQQRSTPHRTLPEEYRSGGDPSIAGWGVEMFNGAPAKDRQIAWESRGTARAGDFVVEKYLLRYRKMLEMPLIFIHAESDKKREVLLWFGENGKAGPSDWRVLQGLVRSGFDIVTFDVRGLGETRMQFTAVSPDDPALGKLEFDEAYANPLSGVLANHVYNSLLTGRPYLFDMIEDAEVASRFAHAKLQRNVTAVSSTGRGYSVASVVSELLPGVKLINPGHEKILRWSEIIEGQQEVWPIELLVPGGAYLQ